MNTFQRVTSILLMTLITVPVLSASAKAGGEKNRGLTGEYRRLKDDIESLEQRIAHIENRIVDFRKTVADIKAVKERRPFQESCDDCALIDIEGCKTSPEAYSAVDSCFRVYQNKQCFYALAPDQMLKVRSCWKAENFYQIKDLEARISELQDEALTARYNIETLSGRAKEADGRDFKGELKAPPKNVLKSAIDGVKKIFGHSAS